MSERSTTSETSESNDCNRGGCCHSYLVLLLSAENAGDLSGIFRRIMHDDTDTNADIHAFAFAVTESDTITYAESDSVCGEGSR